MHLRVWRSGLRAGLFVLAAFFACLLHFGRTVKVRGGPRRQIRSRAGRCGFRRSSERIDLSKNTTPSPEHQASSQSKRISEDADLATANVLGADRQRASTKRTVLIGMLETAQGRVGHQDRGAARLAAAYKVVE